MVESEEYMYKFYDTSLFVVSNLEENIHLILYSALAFFIPFLLGHPQLLVGSIVNCALILGATYLKGHKLLPVILLPSLGVLTAGVIFGSYTIFLLYLVPFIWIGNAIFAYGYKWMQFVTKKYYLAVPASAAIKTLFLFGAASLLIFLHVIPAVFMATMGLFQLYTALIGGAVAAGIILAKERFVEAKKA